MEPEAVTVEQAGQVDDFVYVPQDVEETAAPAKPEQPGKEKPLPEVPAKPENTGKEKPVEESPDFLKEFYGEDGTVDLNKFASNFRPQGEPAKLENFVKPEITGPKPVDSKAQWEKFIEERNKYEGGLRSGLGVVNDFIEKYVQRYYPGDQSVQNFVRQMMSGIAPDIDGLIRQDVTRWEAEARAKADDTRLTQERERNELAQNNPRSESNHVSVAAEFKMTKEKLDSVLFDPRFGGQDIMYLFKVSNPSDANKTGEELKSALSSWYTKFTANRDNLKYLAERAQARVHQHLWPQVIKRIRGMDETQLQNVHQAAVKAPGQRQQTQKSSQNPLETYLNRRPGQRVDDIG